MTSSPWLPEEDDRSQVDEQSSSSPHPGLYRVADAEVSLNTKQSIKANELCYIRWQSDIVMWLSIHIKFENDLDLGRGNSRFVKLKSPLMYAKILLYSRSSYFLHQICLYEIIKLFCTIFRISANFRKKFETVLMGYSVAGGKLIHEKNQKQKISWHYPFKPVNRFHKICEITRQKIPVYSSYKKSAKTSTSQDVHAASLYIIWYTVGGCTWWKR